MPEGPEVRRITDKFRARIKDKFLLSLVWFPQTKYSNKFDNLWPVLSEYFPSKCLDIICRGKQIFFFFENGISFISSLGTEGHWYYFKAGESSTYSSSKNYAKFYLNFGKIHDVFCIHEDEWWYDDMLSYGNFTMTNWQGALDKMNTIGPDLLATVHPFENINNVVGKYLYEIIQKSATVERYKYEIRIPQRSRMELCRFLMENKYISGVGNYLKSEILYRAQLHPNRLVGSLTDDEILRLHSVSLKTISESYKCGGLTHGTFLDPDMQKGTFPIYVYKRAGQKDPNGYIIQSIKTKDKRTSYFVAELQN